jgi:hypothetical protein
VSGIASGGTPAAADVVAPAASGSRDARRAHATEAGTPVGISAALGAQRNLAAAITAVADATTERILSAQTGVAPSAGAIVLERGAEAQAITTVPPPLSPREQPQTAALAPDLQRWVAQFELLARDSTAVSAAAAAPALARAATRELALESVALSAPPQMAGAPRPPAAAVRSRPDAWIAAAPAEGSGYDAAQSSFARLDTLKGALHHPALRAQAESGTSPTVAESLPSTTGAAFGNGGTGLAAPAAALLVVAALCLLGTRLPGRLAEDRLAWKSALFSLRLERPG